MAQTNLPLFPLNMTCKHWYKENLLSIFRYPSISSTKENEEIITESLKTVFFLILKIEIMHKGRYIGRRYRTNVYGIGGTIK